jgi:hypothetical protein
MPMPGNIHYIKNAISSILLINIAGSIYIDGLYNAPFKRFTPAGFPSNLDGEIVNAIFFKI